MYRAVEIKVHKETEKGTIFYVLAPDESLTDQVMKFSNDGYIKGELRIDDGRLISAEQRKKTHALIGDIADFFGYPPEDLKEQMKCRFMAATGEDYFTLSNCDMTTARLFISHLIDFAMEWPVPLNDSAINRTDDINAAIYSSLKHKRCIVCGKDGEVHHWDAIGIGRDRTKVDDSKLRKLCLCRIHHTEAHQLGRKKFEEKYHVYGIIFNE